MKRKCLAIGISISAVILLVLGSLSNVVGFQTVQSSNQQTIKEEVNQRELLFQTIVDITNNKEIQRIILKSQMMNGKFFDPDAKLTTPITKNQLRQIFFIGLILSKIISKSRMQSIIGKYQLSNSGIQKEISAVIEKDVTLNAEITQLQNSECDCKNENTTVLYYPVLLCTILLCIFALSLFLFYTFYLGAIILIITDFLITIFQCLGYP
jgi:hypothetical protein